MTITSRAAGSPLFQLGKNVSVGWLWELAIKDGTSLAHRGWSHVNGFDLHYTHNQHGDSHTSQQADGTSHSFCEDLGDPASTADRVETQSPIDGVQEQMIE